MIKGSIKKVLCATCSKARLESAESLQINGPESYTRRKAKMALLLGEVS